MIPEKFRASATSIESQIRKVIGEQRGSAPTAWQYHLRDALGSEYFLFCLFPGQYAPSDLV